MTSSLELSVGGMHCDACARRLRKVLERVPGLRVDDVQVGSARLTLEGATESAVTDAITGAGFTVAQGR